MDLMDLFEIPAQNLGNCELIWRNKENLELLGFWSTVIESQKFWARTQLQSCFDLVI